MTTRYDAWSELPAPLAEALRASLYSGDWSAWEPDVVEAFRRALNDGDWSAFDPQAAATIRAAIGQEQIAFEAKASQDRIAAEVQADRALASEMRELTAKYTDFGANAKAILDLAVRGNIADLDAAYRTWRSSTGHDGPELAGQPTEPTATDAHEPSPVVRFREIEALLADETTTPDQRRKLKWEKESLMDADGGAIGLAQQHREALKADRDPHTIAEREAHRRELLNEANFERARANSEKAHRRESGHSDMSKPKKPRAELDLEALDLISGRTQPPTPKRKSSAERAADNAGLDDLDRKALALMQGESIGEPPISSPNAEAVLQETTSESGN